MHSVIIVEDEVIIALELEQIVKNNRLNLIAKVRNQDDAYTVLQNHHIDIVLLDINLAGEYEGIDIAKYINESYPEISIIFLTSYSDEMILDAISKVSYTAYVLKPFKREELDVLLILEKMKKLQNNSMIELTVDYVLDNNKGLLHYENTAFPLTQKEFRLLRTLACYPKNVFSFDEIEMTVWSEKGVNANTRRNLIYKLNKKLPIPLVKTRAGIGYTLQ